MRLKMSWSFVLVLLLVGISNIETFDRVPFPDFSMSELTERVAKGKEEMDKLRRHSMLPTGSCWKAALEDLQLSCKGMEGEQHGRLALKFTTCYNQMFGFSTIICERYTPMTLCMKNLDDSSRATFRDFFLHTQDMCYFIEHQMWQEKTNEAVNGVTNAVVDVTKGLETAIDTQQTILQSQQESLKVQSNIIRDNTLLHTMVVDVKDVFVDVQASAMEQRQVFIEIFDKLSKMQQLVSWIQGEMSLLDMMGFYLACIVFGIFATASERTHSARYYIVILMICSLGFERFLFKYLQQNSNLTPEAMQEWIWVVRRSAAILGVIIIVITAAYYRDPQTVQNNILADMNRNMAVVLAYIEDKRKQNQHGTTRALEGNRLPNVVGELDENLDLSGNDTDTYSNYSNDSDGEVTDIVGASQPSRYNDENQVPETDPGVTNKLYHHIVTRVASSPLRERSMDRSSANHSYNLRTRKPSESRDSFLTESPTAFAKQVKRPKKKVSIPAVKKNINYFSSDDE